MGCGASRHDINDSTTPKKDGKLTKLATSGKSMDIKSRAHEAIKKGELFLLYKVFEGEGLRPYDNISHKRSGYTCLHYASKVNAFEIMDYFLDWISSNEQNRITEIINLQDSDGNTPAMICCIYDSNETFYTLMESGSTNDKIRNKQGLTLYEIALKTGPLCLAIIHSFMNQKIVGQPGQSLPETNRSTPKNKVGKEKKGFLESKEINTKKKQKEALVSGFSLKIPKIELNNGGNNLETVATEESTELKKSSLKELPATSGRNSTDTAKITDAADNGKEKTQLKNPMPSTANANNDKVAARDNASNEKIAASNEKIASSNDKAAASNNTKPNTGNVTVKTTEILEPKQSQPEKEEEKPKTEDKQPNIDNNKPNSVINNKINQQSLPSAQTASLEQIPLALSREGRTEQIRLLELNLPIIMKHSRAIKHLSRHSSLVNSAGENSAFIEGFKNLLKDMNDSSDILDQGPKKMNTDLGTSIDTPEIRVMKRKTTIVRRTFISNPEEDFQKIATLLSFVVQEERKSVEIKDKGGPDQTTMPLEELLHLEKLLESLKDPKKLGAANFKIISSTEQDKNLDSLPLLHFRSSGSRHPSFVPQRPNILKPKPNQSLQQIRTNLGRDRLTFDDPNVDPILRNLDPNSNIYKVLQPFVLAKDEGKNYIDLEFPHTLESICRNTSHEHYENFKTLIWQRPKDFLKDKSISMFEDLNPNDIEQGVLGICYLLASLSSLAEYPSRLMSIFSNIICNPYGAYAVNFYKMGIPMEIVVDDYFPCVPAQNKPFFSHSTHGEIWVMVIEKAWAKNFGNYIVTEKGNSESALEEVTGAPSHLVKFKANESESVWKDLLEYDKKRYLLATGTNSGSGESIGLQKLHTYSILGIYDVEKYKLIKLRNPWGKGEWKGQFSAGSKLWNEDLKMQVHYCSGHGVFFMTLEEFMKYFEDYTVCFYKDRWNYNWMTALSEPKHPEYFEFTITKPTELCLRVHQMDARYYAEKDSSYEYSPCSILLAKVQGEDIVRIADGEKYGAAYGRKSVWTKENTPFIKLEPGRYITRVKIDWKNKKSNEFTLSAYSDNPVDLMLMDRSGYNDFLYKWMISLVPGINLKEVSDGCRYGSTWIQDRILMIYGENKGTTKNFIVNVKFENMVNMKIGKWCKLSETQISLDLKPGEVEIAYLKGTGNPVGTEWTYSFLYQDL